MLLPKLAYKNLIGAGLRTWLNVFVTSLSFFILVLMYGLYNGMYEYALEIMLESEIGGGIYYHPAYDEDDALTIEDSHGILPESISTQVERGEAAPVLMVQAAMYVDGRMTPLLMKGIPPEQTVVNMPTKKLTERNNGYVSALVGRGMATSYNLEIGEMITIRWRDTNGTYDADEVMVAEIMATENFRIDKGQIWLPLEALQQMMDIPGEATYVVTSSEVGLASDAGDWVPRDIDYMLRDMANLVQQKKAGGIVMFIILMGIAALGIFNSQILSIFRRTREIGTLMALGMNRGKVISLFTIEGGMHGMFALVLTAIYGSPLLWYLATNGIAIPYGQDFGFVIGTHLYPVFGLSLIFSSALLVTLIVTVISYLPTRKIAKLHPTDALRGRWA